MKKLTLLLLALLALTVRAAATDVQIQALTVDGFSPSGIGSDRLIAVSTAGGSPTITSAALFPAQIVGMAGFRVLIDGSQYTVASVASTSSLTLTTNYSGTPGAQTMTLYKYVELRVYADRAFQPAGGAQIVQPGTVGSGNFFRRFAASAVNNGATDQLFIPSITLPATTDALITNQAKYSFPFYRPGTTSQLEFFLCPSSMAQLRLPPATPTTWTAICQFNSPSAVIPPNNEAYTKTQIDARLPSCSLNNGVYYSANGNLLSCLTFGSGLTVVGSTLTATGGGTGYATVQEEGGALAQRGILNFIGAGLTAADNGGATRTDVSVDPDLNALAANSSNGFWAHTGAGTGAARLFQAPAAGFTISNNDGVAGNPTFVLANDLAALEGLGTTGIPARTAADTWAIRTLTAPAAGLTITNPGGVAGNPTFAFANDLGAIEALGATGAAHRTGTDTWALRTLTGPAAGITVMNGDGVAGNPTLALANDLAALEGISSTGIPQRTGVDTWSIAPDVTAIEALSTTGLATRTAADTWTTRTLTGTTGQVTLTNGDGVSGNPTASLPTTVFLGTAGGSPAAGALTGPDASGTNTAGAPLELSGGKATGNAEPGAVTVRYPLRTSSGSSVQSLSSTRFPVAVGMYTNTGNGTGIANTTTETSVFSGATASSGSTFTIEGGLTAPGTVYRVSVRGQFGATAGPTGRVRAKLGSTTIADTSTFTVPNTGGGIFIIMFDIRVSSVGATGSAAIEALRGEFIPSTGGATPTLAYASGSQTIDFTASQAIDVTFQWGTANASNSITMTQTVVERIR